jgi:hypothetical protein
VTDLFDSTAENKEEKEVKTIHTPSLNSGGKQVIDTNKQNLDSKLSR